MQNLHFLFFFTFSTFLLYLRKVCFCWKLFATNFRQKWKPTERTFPDAVRQMIYPVEQIELHQPDEHWGGSRGCYAYNWNLELRPTVSWRQCLVDCALKGFHLAGFQGEGCACVTQVRLYYQLLERNFILYWVKRLENSIRVNLQCISIKRSLYF